MTSTEDGSLRPRAALHLFWTVPLATLLSIPVFAIGGLTLCGISGCSGGGFGPTSAARETAWVCSFVVGGLYFFALGFVPWIRPALVRILLSALVAAAIGGAVALDYLTTMR